MKASPSRPRMLTACVVCALALAAPMPAQEKKEGKSEPAVAQWAARLNVSVFDAQNRPVTSLNAEDFEILEDGVAQKVTHFERREGPLTFGLVVDNSGSFRSLMNDVVGVGHALVEASGPDAEIFVVRFVGSKSINIVQPLTTNKARLGGALDDMFVEGGQTAINDAVYLSADYLAQFKAGQSAPRRYGLVLITDGEDRKSNYKPAQVHQKLREAGVPLYALGLWHGEIRGFQETTPEKAGKYLERLAFESGGRAHLIKKRADLAPAVRQILAELSAPYALGYVPTSQKRDGRKRKLEVRAKGSAGPLTVHTKNEYTAPEK